MWNNILHSHPCPRVMSDPGLNRVTPQTGVDIWRKRNPWSLVVSRDSHWHWSHLLVSLSWVHIDDTNGVNQRNNQTVPSIVLRFYCLHVAPKFTDTGQSLNWQVPFLVVNWSVMTITFLHPQISWWVQGLVIKLYNKRIFSSSSVTFSSSSITTIMSPPGHSVQP